MSATWPCGLESVGHDPMKKSLVHVLKVQVVCLGTVCEKHDDSHWVPKENTGFADVSYCVSQACAVTNS